MNKNDDKLYEVGYGKPPIEMRFKGGQSGNPKGRPKGSQNVATVLSRTLRERLTITENGRRKTITKLEAAVKQITNKGASGDLASLKVLFALVRSIEEKADRIPVEKEDLSESDQDVMKSILKQLKRNSGGSDEE